MLAVDEIAVGVEHRNHDGHVVAIPVIYFAQVKQLEIDAGEHVQLRLAAGLRHLGIHFHRKVVDLLARKHGILDLLLGNRHLILRVFRSPVAAAHLQAHFLGRIHGDLQSVETAVELQVLRDEAQEVQILGRGGRLAHTAIEIVVAIYRSASILRQREEFIGVGLRLKLSERNLVLHHVRGSTSLAGVEAGHGPDAPRVDAADQHLGSNGAFYQIGACLLEIGWNKETRRYQNHGSLSRHRCHALDDNFERGQRRARFMQSARVSIAHKLHGFIEIPKFVEGNPQREAFSKIILGGLEANLLVDLYRLKIAHVRAAGTVHRLRDGVGRNLQ